MFVESACTDKSRIIVCCGAKTPQSLRALAGKGGGAGLNRVVSAITVNDAFREYFRKFIEKRQRAGIAAPGESGDVFNFIPEYNDARRFKKLADDLAQRGQKTTRIENVLGGNFARLFAEVWAA